MSFKGSDEKINMKYNTVLFLILLSFLFQNNYAQQRPNVVFILADDLDDVVTPQFFKDVLPFTDSLMKENIVFTNSFVPMSVCCPSRAATLSGKYAHKTGVYNNGGDFGGRKIFIDDEPKTVAAVLSKSGYRTAMIGKYLNGFHYKRKKLPAVPYGWTDGVLHINPRLRPYKGYDYKLIHWNNGAALNDTVWEVKQTVKEYGDKPEDYSTDVFAKEAKQFLSNTEEKDEQPFFLFLTPTAPHFPIPPAPRHREKAIDNWADKPVPAAPNTFNDKGKLATVNELKKPLDKPEWLKNTWRKRQRQKNKGRWLYNLAFENVPRQIKAYKDADWFNRMGSLYALDEMVRDVVKTLKETGEFDNTLFIFTSDNGYQLGNHSLYQKATPYEEAIRVPLMIAAGKNLKVKQKMEVPEWVTNLDLMPTILRFADIEVPADIDGISLKELVTESPTTVSANTRDKILFEYNGPGMMGYLTKAYWLQFRGLPSYYLDQPTFRAIRMKVKDDNNEERVFKYIEWQRYPQLDKFRELLEKNDPEWKKKIESKNKRTLRKVAKAAITDKELYDVTNDPYELDNLLYYKPDEYKKTAELLKNELYQMMKK